MQFGNPKALFLLILIPIALILVFLTKKLRINKFSKFAESRFYDYYFQQFSSFKFNLKNIFLIIALFFMIIAIFRPQWVREIQIVQNEGVDIVMCMDVCIRLVAVVIHTSRN